MSRFTRKLFTSLAVAAPMIVAAPTVAHAAVSDAVVVAGTGRIFPGLTLNAAPQTIDFGFTAVVAGDETNLLTGCMFHGTSSGLATVLSDVGSGTLGGCPATGTVTYTRTGPLVQVHGSIAVNGVTHTIGASALVFVPTSVNPTTTFIEVGTVELDD